MTINLKGRNLRKKKVLLFSCVLPESTEVNLTNFPKMCNPCKFIAADFLEVYDSQGILFAPNVDYWASSCIICSTLMTE